MFDRDVIKEERQELNISILKLQLRDEAQEWQNTFTDKVLVLFICGVFKDNENSSEYIVLNMMINE